MDSLRAQRRQGHDARSAAAAVRRLRRRGRVGEPMDSIAEGRIDRMRQSRLQASGRRQNPSASEREGKDSTTAGGGAAWRQTVRNGYSQEETTRQLQNKLLKRGSLRWGLWETY